MSNKFEALFEDEGNIFGGTPASKYHDIANQASDEVVKDEFDRVVEKFAAMEQMLQEVYPNEDLDRKIKNHIFENSSYLENQKKSLYIEFTGNIVMRLDS